MGRAIAFTFILVSLIITGAITIDSAHAEVSPDTWASKAPMHEARSGLGVAAVNGKIYAIGGATESGFIPSIPGSAVLGDIGGYVGTNEEYNPATDTWSYKTAMPTPRILFAIAVYQNKIYCIGGKTSNSTYTDVNEVYDPSTDTWETKAPLPVAEGWLTANVVGDKIYVIDFWGRNYVFNPVTNSWTTKAQALAPAWTGFASAALDEKIYVVGGISQGQDYALNQIYNVETDSWSYGLRPPSSVDGGAAAATTGTMAPKRIYVIGNPGNLRQGEEQTYVRIYNPSDDSWMFGTDIITRRFNFGIAVINDTLYVIGGHTYSFPGNYAPVAVNEQYTPIGYGNPNYTPDTAPPEITVISPENKTYYATNIPLIFTVSESDTKMSCRIDNQTAFHIEGNTTLTGLSSGPHSLTIFATDNAGNTGASPTVYFTITSQPETEPFLTTPVITVAAIIIAVATVIILVSYRKHKRSD